MSIHSSLPFAGLFLFVFVFFSACNNDSLEEVPTPEERIIWTGSSVSFSKSAGSDPNSAENQDRITDNVWITRGNNGGQIYNAASEGSADKQNSPDGILWAIGTIDNIDNLDFQQFRSAVGKPKNVVGKDLVAFLTDDNIFISVKFTQWSRNKAGGFAYERSSEQ